MTSSYYRYRSLHTETCLNFICLNLKIILAIVMCCQCFDKLALCRRRKRNEKKVICIHLKNCVCFLIRFRLLFRHGSGIFLKFLVSDFKFFYWFPDLLPTLDVEDRSQPSPQNLLLATPVFSALTEID